MAYYARHDYTGNGALKNFSVSFPYISTTHVEVYVGGVKKTLGVDYTFSNSSTIALTVAPGSGVAVLIKRNTPKDQRLVDYQDASVLTEDVLDLASIQMMYITQEQLDTGVEAVAIASAAETKADSAVATANSANTTANSANSTANTALANSNTAISTANSATSTANTALNTANTASANATSAVNTANTANSTANSANTSATNAVNTANSALATANSAVSTANSAVSTANSAASTANSAATTATNADTKATQALADSSSALSMAQSANTAAGNAQFAASSAAADADAAAASAAAAQASVAGIQADVDTLMGGDFSGLMQKAENLAGLTNTATARTNIGLGNVDNTSDLNKPISTATQTALNAKADSATVTTALAGKANTSHTHTIADVTNLQTTLDGKAAASHTHNGADLPQRADWASRGSLVATVGQLGWRQYGNNHTVFDASASTTPTGTACNNTNPSIAWAATYPTLMGFNGVDTYGVRVDRSRYAENLTSNITINGVAANVGSNITVYDGTKIPTSGGALTGQLVCDAGAVQHVSGLKWTYNGATIWQTGREADRNFSLWYYNDAGGYLGSYNFARDGRLTAGALTTTGEMQFNTDAMYIKHYDPSWGGNRWIHSNNGDIGFLDSNGAWSLRQNNFGTLYVSNAIYSGWDVWLASHNTWVGGALDLRVTKDCGYNSVGSFCFARYANTGDTIGAGATLSGSLLNPASINTGNGVIYDTGQTLPGTWRCLGYNVGQRVCLYQRIS